MQENRRVYEIIRFEDVEVKKGHCGIVRRLYENDISLDFVEIKDAKEHYHEKSTEYYFIVEGEGKVILNGREFYVKSGDLVVIPPRIIHKAEGNMKVLVIGVPKVIEHKF